MVLVSDMFAKSNCNHAIELAWFVNCLAIVLLLKANGQSVAEFSGEVHLLAGEHDEAERLASEALYLAIEQKERGNEACARHLIAEIHAARGSIPASTIERDYADALALATALGMRPLAARCHAGFGQWLLRAGRPEASQRHLDTAAEMFREMGMRFWLDKLERERAELG